MKRRAHYPGMRCGRKRCRGFTLIETLVALSLLAAAAGFLLAAQGSASMLTTRVLERESALWLARSRMVEAAAYPDRAPPEDAREDRYEGIAYRTRIEYREIEPLSGADADKLPRQQRLMELRVLVNWGTHSSLQLTTYRPLGRQASADKLAKP